MSQTMLEMTKDLVMAQIQAKQVSPEALREVLHQTHATLCGMQRLESGGENGHGESDVQSQQAPVAVNWKASITRHSIKCLECGQTFKQLSPRHLGTHDLTPRTYRAKYQIPSSQSLSARDVTARRRELAQRIRPWELVPSKQPAAAKAASPAKTKAPAKTASPRAKARKTAAAKA